MKLKSITFLMLILALALSACGSGSMNSFSLAGTKWDLQSLNGAPIVSGSAPTLEFGKDNQAGGNASCNSFGGEYTQDGDKLSFGPLMMTMMACMDNGLMDQEFAFSTALAAVKTFSVSEDGSTLSLKDEAGNELMVLVTYVSAELTGHTWQATAVNNGAGGVVSRSDMAEISAEFMADGTLSGSAGCNTYNTTYTIDGNKISISDKIATTRMACPEDVMQQEAEFLAALPLAATFELGKTSLELRDAGGALLVSFNIK